MKKYGISVIALTANIIAVNPIVWKRVETGDYVIVLASPEVFLQYTSVFLFRTARNKCSTFNKRLVCITIDEVYLI